MICEVCGSQIRTMPVRVRIDDAVFMVCPGCSRLGTPISSPATTRAAPAPGSQVRTVKLRTKSRPPSGWPRVSEPELELRKDFGQTIRRAREVMGLSQEVLGRKLNEKLSVVRLLEGRRLKPDDSLARKLEHFLKIKLLVPAEAE